MNGACNSTIFWPRPLVPWGGAKRPNIIKSQLQTLSQFQRFLNQTLCVFSQIKHIRQDFHLVLLVMPQGFGLGGAGGQKFNFLNTLQLAKMVISSANRD